MTDVQDQAEVTAPSLPQEFWQAQSLQDAFRARHFGQLLKAYRRNFTPMLNQSDLARWLGLTQGQISRIERSTNPVTDLVKLSSWALTLHIPVEFLWFSVDSEESPSAATSPILDADLSEDDNVQRRTLFKTMGLGASLLTVAADHESLSRQAEPLQYAIGKSDVEVMREMTRNFRRLDNRFGGGHASLMLNNYLNSHVLPTLQSGRYSAALQSSLFVAAAELFQLAGWMAYDTGNQTGGQRHLRKALELCQEVRNDGLAAEMLAGMSHQASFHRQADSAVELAVAAGYTAQRAGIPKLQAEAAVMEAHGLALRGDHRACITTLQQAERHFIRSNSEPPDWLDYFDEAYLSAKFGHTLRDLRRPADAERFARNSLQMTDGYERGRFFNTALLAGILADQGKLEESLQYATLAVRMSTDLRSSRTKTYLADVRNRLLPYKKKESVAALYRSMKSVGVNSRLS